VGLKQTDAFEHGKVKLDLKHFKNILDIDVNAQSFDLVVLTNNLELNKFVRRRLLFEQLPLLVSLGVFKCLKTRCRDGRFCWFGCNRQS
jgi:hypothetical protein